VAASLNHLGAAREARGDLAGAESFYLRALALWEQVLGPEHPDAGTARFNLGGVRAALGRHAAAWTDLHRAFSGRLAQAEALLPVLPERAREDFLATVARELEAVLTLAALRATDLPTQQQALELVLRHQGLILASLQREREAVAAARDPRLRARLEAQRRARRWLNHLVLGGPGQLEAGRYAALVASARQDLEAAEEALGRASQDRIGRVPPVRLSEVARVLGADEALLVYVRHDAYQFPTTAQAPRWGAARYGAFVLQATGQVAYADLGPAVAVDAAVSGTLAGVKESVGLAERDEGLARRVLRTRGQTLHARALAPALRHVGRARRIWVVPAGTLGQVPLSLAVSPEGRPVTARHELLLLGAGRDLLRIAPAASGPAAAGAVALVAPDFGPASGPAGAAPFAPVTWKPAFGTGLAGALGAVLGPGGAVRLLPGSAATEAALRRVERPRILHLFTHGFYLDEVEAQERVAARAGGALPSALGEAARLLADPMRRSGIALAGANRGFPAAGGALARSGDDGILTAEEASTLDLRGTELVVVGACQSGVGEARPGEGIYGLRRALLHAGARTLLLSLWRVPEEATRELLEAFYRELAVGRTRSEALARAQRQVARRLPLPYHWAGFVLVGDPGKLR
jgi:tetratricopeptide (TPR) repeat protein